MSSVNLTVLRGVCSAPPEIRQLESGRRVASLSVRAPAGAERATSVPVTVWEPPAWLEGVDAGEELVVIGHVRRRFFRVATGSTGARVDVEADAVARARDRRRTEALLRRVDGALASLE